MFGNTVVTAVILAIGENGPKIAYFSHSARCAPCWREAPPGGGGGGWHKASVSDCLPLAAPIGLSPLLSDPLWARTCFGWGGGGTTKAEGVCRLVLPGISREGRGHGVLGPVEPPPPQKGGTISHHISGTDLSLPSWPLPRYGDAGGGGRACGDAVSTAG